MSWTDYNQEFKSESGWEGSPHVLDSFTRAARGLYKIISSKSLWEYRLRLVLWLFNETYNGTPLFKGHLHSGDTKFGPGKMFT